MKLEMECPLGKYKKKHVQEQKHAIIIALKPNAAGILKWFAWLMEGRRSVTLLMK
jgi:hypothetical protein